MISDTLIEFVVFGVIWVVFGERGLLFIVCLLVVYGCICSLWGGAVTY